MNSTVTTSSLVATLLIFATVAETQTRIVDLGTLGGTSSWSVAINNSGQVVGDSYLDGDIRRHAFSWTPALGMIDLGTLGGSWSRAVGVNAKGHVVGDSALPGDATSHAFVWTAVHGIVDLGTLGGNSSAAAIDERGRVVGFSGEHAFLWTRTRGMLDLGTLGGSWSRAVAINRHGQVVGESALPGSTESHAFSWTPGGGMIDLGTLGGPWSRAIAVNSAGQVVGESAVAGGTAVHAFSWTADGGMTDLGTLGGSDSHPSAVNAAGQVVGSSHVLDGEAESHLFSWSATNGMVDLETRSGLWSSEAVAINNPGHIVGNTSYFPFTFESHAFSWTLGGGIVDLPELDAPESVSRVVAVNRAGQIVGASGEFFDWEHATLWDPNGYDFDFSGIRRAPEFNEVRAGRPLAVTFTLGDDFGLAIFAANGPSLQSIACDASGVLNEREVAATGRLLYTPQINRYAFAMKTDPAWAGTCRQLNMRLNDGSNHVVYFQFK
jgi:probable HAF family extracellular repeat protein